MESETYGEDASCPPPSLLSTKSPQKPETGRQGQLSSFCYSDMETKAHGDLPEGASQAALAPTPSGSRVRQVKGLESTPSQGRVMQTAASLWADPFQLLLGPATAQTGGCSGRSLTLARFFVSRRKVGV